MTLLYILKNRAILSDRTEPNRFRTVGYCSSRQWRREKIVAREYPPRPLVGIGVVVWRGPEVLLIQRGKAPRSGQWSLPGGAQKLGETVAEGGRREVMEEAGVEVEITGLLDVIDSIQPDGDGRIRYHYTLVDLAAEWQAGEPRAGGDAAAARFVDADDLAAYELWDETLRIIALSAARRPGS